MLTLGMLLLRCTINTLIRKKVCALIDLPSVWSEKEFKSTLFDVVTPAEPKEQTKFGNTYCARKRGQKQTINGNCSLAVDKYEQVSIGLERERLRLRFDVYRELVGIEIEVLWLEVGVRERPQSPSLFKFDGVV